MTRVIVTGDRNWDCKALAERVVQRLVAAYGTDLVIVHGNARGVDTAFAVAATEAGVTHEPHQAQWDIMGPGAGPARNAAMIQAGANFVIAVHRQLSRSKGTKDCVLRAFASGLPVYLIDSADAEPRRIRAVTG